MSTAKKQQIQFKPGMTIVCNGASWTIDRRATVTIRDYSGPVLRQKPDLSSGPDGREEPRNQQWPGENRGSIPAAVQPKTPRNNRWR